jgi:hypothetical protein
MSNFMMNMISWVLLLLVILTLYLIDKINHLAKMYEAPKPETPGMSGMSEFESELPGDLLFSGLEGKKLWDAMNGKQVEGFDATMIEALRPHYEPILREHIIATAPSKNIRTVAADDAIGILGTQHIGEIFHHQLSRTNHGQIVDGQCFLGQIDRQ